MTDSAPVTDNREVLTHNHIPEDLVARSRHSDGKIQLGEIRWQHRARDPHGNLLPDPPRFGDLLTPALDDPVLPPRGSSRGQQAGHVRARTVRPPRDDVT